MATSVTFEHLFNVAGNKKELKTDFSSRKYLTFSLLKAVIVRMLFYMLSFEIFLLIFVYHLLLNGLLSVRQVIHLAGY